MRRNGPFGSTALLRMSPATYTGEDVIPVLIGRKPPRGHNVRLGRYVHLRQCLGLGCLSPVGVLVAAVTNNGNTFNGETSSPSRPDQPAKRFL